MARVFTRRLMLHGPVRIADGGGGYSESWQERGALWAEVRMRSGALRHTEFGRTPRLMVRITTHDLPDGHPMRPVTGDRLIDGRKVFEVDAVHDGDRRLLVILASELSGTEMPG